MEHSLETARGPLVIRPIRAEDVAGFRDLRLDAFKRHADIFYGVDYVEQLAKPLSHWQEQVCAGLDGRTGMIFVAEVGEALVGTLALERDGVAQFRHNGRI